MKTSVLNIEHTMPVCIACQLLSPKQEQELSFNLQVPGLIHLDNWRRLPFGHISQNDSQSSQHFLHSRHPILRISLVVAGPNGFAQL